MPNPELEGTAPAAGIEATAPLPRVETEEEEVIILQEEDASEEPAVETPAREETSGAASPPAAEKTIESKEQKPATTP